MTINNNALYNAAFVGAVAGINERWINSTNQASYDSMYAAARRLAATIDALIAPTTITDCEGALLKGIVQGSFANRFPQTTQDFNDISQAIVACFNDGITSLQPCPAAIGGYATIQVNGVALPAETTVNFVASDVHGADNPPVTTISFGNESVSVSHSPSIVQVGSSVTNPAFTASYATAPTTALLTDTEGHSDNITSSPNAFVSPHVFTKGAYGQSVTFTVAVTSSAGPASGTNTISWVQQVLWGAVVDPGVYDSAFINSLANSSLQFTGNGTFHVVAGAGQSTFYSSRTAFGLTPADFFVGGFPFAISKVASAVPRTNSDGVTENYDVWRSDNVALGDFSFLVT
jgi:hypothetical protein